MITSPFFSYGGDKGGVFLFIWISKKNSSSNFLMTIQIFYAEIINTVFKLFFRFAEKVNHYRPLKISKSNVRFIEYLFLKVVQDKGCKHLLLFIVLIAVI